jgi:AGZA family xanthine/uracil permease-like MFS transporter
MTACFLSGAALALCALAQLSTVIMRVIPRAVKLATVVGMGLLIALIGMVSIGLVVPNEDTLVTLGDLSDYHIWLALFGLIVTGRLRKGYESDVRGRGSRHFPQIGAPT